MANTCIVPNCDFNSILNGNCMHHDQLQTVGIKAIYCIIPACMNKIKKRNHLMYCLKHSKKFNSCCYKNCAESVCTDSKENFCKKHLFKRQTEETPKKCIKNQCGEIARNDLCIKHSMDPDICCQEECLDKKEYYGDFCLKHLKRNLLCEVKQCFSSTVYVKNVYCERHCKNLNLCFIKFCQEEKEIGCHGVCKTHSKIYYKVKNENKMDVEIKSMKDCPENMDLMFTDLIDFNVSGGVFDLRDIEDLDLENEYFWDL